MLFSLEFIKQTKIYILFSLYTKFVWLCFELPTIIINIHKMPIQQSFPLIIHWNHQIIIFNSIILVYVHRAVVLYTNTLRNVEMFQSVDSAKKSYMEFDQLDQVNVPEFQSGKKPFVEHMVVFCVIFVFVNELFEHFWLKNKKLLKCLKMHKHQDQK